jgi:polyisoprenoid-binding protein YceI
MLRKSLILAAALAAPLATAAAPAQKAAPAPAPASASGWAVNYGASRLAFTAAMNGQAINGAFRRWQAQVRFDPRNLAASDVKVEVDTGSAATGDASRDQSLPTDDWFAARAFPRATFTSQRFVALGGDRYQAIGTLSIRGVSRPVTLPFRLTLAGDKAHVEGSVPIDRTAFGVGQNQWKGTEAVAARVDVHVSIDAQKAG